MKQYIINEQSLKAVIDYLAERPFKEVYQAISALQSLPEAPAEAKNAE